MYENYHNCNSCVINTHVQVLPIKSKEDIFWSRMHAAYAFRSRWHAWDHAASFLDISPQLLCNILTVWYFVCCGLGEKEIKRNQVIYLVTLKKKSASWVSSKISSSPPKSSDFYTVTCGLITLILVCLLAVKLAKWLLFVSIDNYRIITDYYVFCDINHTLSLFSKVIMPSHSPLISWFLYFQENKQPKIKITCFSTFYFEFVRGTGHGCYRIIHINSVNIFLI